MHTLSFLYEDEYIGVVDKPSCLHTISTKETSLSTLLSEKSLLPESGLIQRLDYETQGACLFAKTEKCFEFLKNEIKEHRVKKEYLAKISERPSFESSYVEGYLGSRHRGSKKVTYSKTPLKRFLYFSMEVTIVGSSGALVKTSYGRRHQVRVGLQSIGLPLVGDTLYGGALSNRPFFLLASKITFLHPHTQQELTVSCSRKDEFFP